MQRNILAAALFASLPFAAAAQSSVSIYGIADAALAREDNGAANGSKTVLNSGNQSSSRLGFRGTEDLGNGLKAIFNLEAGYAIDTGAGIVRRNGPIHAIWQMQSIFYMRQPKS